MQITTSRSRMHIVFVFSFVLQKIETNIIFHPHGSFWVSTHLKTSETNADYSLPQ